MITQTISYKKNESLIINPTELKNMYFYGVPIRSKDGFEITDELFVYYIKAAQEEVEKFLSVKVEKQFFMEQLSFYRDEFEAFGYIKTTYPVVKPYVLDGFIGSVKQISYPKEWLSSRTTSDRFTYNRMIYIVPNVGAAQTNSLVYNGIVPYLGILGYVQIPNYWSVGYITGYDRIPSDLLNVIGMLAAINAFILAGDLIISPGLINQSLSLDGLSQSVSTGKSSSTGAFQGRINGYLTQIKTTLERLRTSYKGVNISSM